MSKALDIAIASVMLVVGLGLLSMTFGDGFDIRTFGGDVGPAFVPKLFLFTWSILAAINLAQTLLRAPNAIGSIRLGQWLAVVGIAVVTALAMTRIGFVFATVPGLAAFCWAFGYRKLLPLALISILAPIGIWALFTFGFELLLPRSPWFHQI
ncbi:MAG: tripartite tricarboxylate transporter TctB family protein [Pseudomonadota bacterium]